MSTDRDPETRLPGSEAEEDLIEELADRYLDDLRAGRIPAHVELILAYPELAVPLVRRLSLVRRLHRAGCAPARDRAAPEKPREDVPESPPGLKG
jgi:hypothetical protein